MSNLIITIIAIALGAAVVVASMFSGGEAMTQGSAKAMATAVLNQGQQISGAATMYANDKGGKVISALADLTDGKYLKSIPTPPASVHSAGDKGWVLDTTDKEFTVEADNTEICLQVDKQANPASTLTAPATVKPGTIFGCWDNGTSFEIFYKQ